MEEVNFYTFPSLQNRGPKLAYIKEYFQILQYVILKKQTSNQNIHDKTNHFPHQK